MRALVVIALCLQLGCSNLSRNNRRGLMLVGGAGVIVGALMISDGVGCDPTGGGNDCDDDGRILALGLTTFALGAVLVGAMIYANATSDPPPQ